MDLIFSGQLFVSVLFLGVVYALTAIGLNLVYGTLRLLNIAHGDLIMLGAYVGFWGFSLFAISPFLSMFAAALLGAGLALVIYALLLRPMIQRVPANQLEANSLLIFFGVSVVLQNLTSMAFSADQRAYRYFDETLDLGLFTISEARLAILIIGLVLCGCIIAALRMTSFGLALSALIQNRVAASVVGVNVQKVQIASLAVGFALAMFAGTLMSMTLQVQPFIGFNYTIAALLVIILGGLGNIRGGIFAGFVLAALEIYGSALISQNARSILLYGLFVLILVLRPEGLAGRRAS